MSKFIEEIDSKIKYPHILVTTLIEGVHQQRFFLEHIPELTDIKKGEDAIAEFYIEMINKMCNK